MLHPEGREKVSRPPSPHESMPQSFLVRVWQENPQHWRGTIRHVQSQTQRGFTKLDQVVSFIGQRIPAATARAAMDQSPPITGVTLDGIWSRRPVQRLAWAAIGLAAVVLIALVVVSPNSNAPLTGAAVGGEIASEIVAFAAGLVLGAIAVYLWFLSRGRR